METEKMFRYVSLDEARQTRAAYIHVTGSPVNDGTSKYFGRIALIESGGAERVIMRRARRTLDELRDRAEELAHQRGAEFIVVDLPHIVLARVTMGISSNPRQR
jgi:hypothetical protein